MMSARDSPAIAGFASSEATSARLSDVDDVAQAPCMAAFERCPLSGFAFLFPAEFATAFLSPTLHSAAVRFFRD